MGSVKKRVIVTLPAYHAETTLEKTVADIPAGVADELILVDDASADDTARLARELGIDVHVHPKNRGYGGNQKTCYTKALEGGAEIVVMLHPDYQYDPKAVPLLIAPILAGDADMTFGSRFAGLGDPRAGGMPIYRFIGNRITTTIENLLLGSRFSEMHSGMRAYTRNCLLSLPFLGYSEDFGFDAQLLVDAVTSGQRVVEVPIPTRYTKESSSIGILRSLKYVATSLAYAARRAAVRGRRGRRYPVVASRTLSPSRRPTPRGADARAIPESGTSKGAAARVADRVGSYVLPGPRVLELDGTGRVEERPFGSLSPVSEGPADVVVVWPDTARPLGDLLVMARAAVVAEGLIGLVLRAGHRPSHEIAHELASTGCRMVEWSSMARVKGQPAMTLVLSRPIAGITAG